MKPAELLKPKYIVFVVLVSVGVLGVLAWSSTIDMSSCEWKSTERKGNTPKPAGAFGLTVKTGDLTLTRDLRVAIEERLRARGFDNLVDNPVQKPRADVALEEGNLRYLPFYATTHAKLRVLVTMPRGAAANPSEHIALDGVCTGLVAQQAWRDQIVSTLADHAADAIAAQER